MSIIGTVVSKDTVKLPAGVELNVGSQVSIQTLGPVADPAKQSETGRLKEVLKEFIGAAEDLPSDLARNHDHYLHGAPKK